MNNLNTHEKFLDFNGRNIYFTSNNGENWVAIKPICEALGVNYNRQFQNLKKDEFFRDAYAIQQMRDSLNRRQKMVCITEKYVYGWLVSINSDSKELKEYKRTCYDLLYNHFHGVITGRRKILQEQRTTRTEINALKEELKENEKFERLVELQQKAKRFRKDLRLNDKEIIETPDLFSGI